MNHRVVVDILGRDDFSDNFALNQISQLVQIDLLAVLYRDDDGVHSLGNAGAVIKSVLGSNLYTLRSR